MEEVNGVLTKCPWLEEVDELCLEMLGKGRVPA